MTEHIALPLNARTGYDPHFLSREVKLPALAPDQLADAVPLLDQPGEVELTDHLKTNGTIE